MRLLARFAPALAIAVLSSAPVTAQQDTVYTIADDIVAPKVVKFVKPQYTRDAMQLGITGSVTLSSIVRSDARITDIEVVESLDNEHGLDQAAIDALKQCQFTPGTKDGKNVSVKITVEMKFTLK